MSCKRDDVSPDPGSCGFAQELVAQEPMLRRIASRLYSCSADADDLVQDTLERALRRRESFDGRHARAWLTTILRNLFIDRCRAAARRPSIVALDEKKVAHSPIRETGRTWAASTYDLRAAAEDLPEPFRAVYVLRAFEGYTYREIAECLDISINTVSSRLRRARQRLKEALISGRQRSLEEPWAAPPARASSY